MSESTVTPSAPATQLDGAWFAAVARARGLALTTARADEVAAAVAPTLLAFRELVADLRPDDDMLELRRRLLAEAWR